MKDNKYAILILMFLLIMLLFYFLSKNIIGLPPEPSIETGTGIEKQKNYNAVVQEDSESINLIGKGRKKYEVFKPKANKNTEENSLEYRLRSGEVVI